MFLTYHDPPKSTMFNTKMCSKMRSTDDIEIPDAGFGETRTENQKTNSISVDRLERDIIKQAYSTFISRIISG